MTLVFQLSMPGCPSWNGKWSGQGKIYAVVKTIGRSAKAQQQAQEILDRGYYSYSWSDGWGAGISVKQATPEQARKVRKLSQGFYGYEWMIESIFRDGYITTEYDKKKASQEAIA